MSAPESPAAAQYKFVVSSADEAITVLRERLGEHARVISVRQVEGAGLARFLRAPKLEVIAQVETPAEAVAPAPEPKIEIPVADLSPLPTSARPLTEKEPAPVPEENLSRILRRAGFNEAMLARLESDEAWPAFVKMPIGTALSEVAMILREEFLRQPRRVLGQRVAFCGTPGIGKTTAMCKRLVTDIFFRQRPARVLKIDLDRANPSDGLTVFCDAIGAPILRDPEEAQTLPDDVTLYVDLPGVAVDRESDIDGLREELQRQAVTSRVLVINAAYDSELIKRAYLLGEKLDATHVVFTHLDELAHWGKLWPFILGQKIQPLFFSAGQNLAGDFTEQIFDSILERTFPAVGSEAAK